MNANSPAVIQDLFFNFFYPNLSAIKTVWSVGNSIRIIEINASKISNLNNLKNNGMQLLRDVIFSADIA
jgi:hypothetical protein